MNNYFMRQTQLPSLRLYRRNGDLPTALQSRVLVQSIDSMKYHLQFTYGDNSRPASFNALSTTP